MVSKQFSHIKPQDNWKKRYIVYVPKHAQNNNLLSKRQLYFLKTTLFSKTPCPTHSENLTSITAGLFGLVFAIIFL
jgi:hypothetical protein